VAAAAGLAFGGRAADEAAPPAGPDVQDIVFFADTRPVLIRLHVRIDGKPFREVFRAAVDEYVKRLFRHLDRNGDGVLSEDEARRCPPPVMSLPGAAGDQAGAANVAFNFRALDADGDGKVTPAELADYYRQFSGGAFQARFFTNPLPNSEALGDVLFNRLDANKDGKLSRQELAAAPASLAKLDLDDDEMISGQELAPQLFRPANPEEVPQPRPARIPSAEDGAFFILSPDDSPALLARQLLARYDPLGKRLPGKKLRPRDIGLDRATFDRLDANKDGLLDANELEKFTDRPADIELLIRLGKRARGEAVLEVLQPADGAPLAGAVRRTRDGQVVLTLGNSRIELRCGNGGLGPEFFADMRRRYLHEFRAADLDRSGSLDAKEARRSRFFRDLFARMDRNGDGRLDEKEMLDYLDRVQAHEAQVLAGRVSLAISDVGRGLFDLLDKNRDGRLGLREIRAAAGLLAELGQGGDGRLPREQIPRSYQLTLCLGQASLNRWTGDALEVSAEGVLAYPADSQVGGPLWFRKMDRNGDGDVSPREFLGSPEDFKRIDADGDGLISVEEAERADALRKKGRGLRP
jgi:Ca2+-binding EF-hand superfamily protein